MICAYILECCDKTYYVGSTNNIERRLVQHNMKQCQHTKSRLPIKLVFTREFSTLKEARGYEYFLKRQRNISFYRKLINGAFV
ncbi:MAG: GIY-YIG nuclease family protein [Candidatus Daviesbacteria bacterium]|nr:GIY-YIG nuclease family protein [Candidatus Daviesbacteria bacterium]